MNDPFSRHWSYGRLRHLSASAIDNLFPIPDFSMFNHHHRPNSERIKFLIEYLSLLPEVDNFSVETVINDILYGVGLCLDSEQFKYGRGYELFLELIRLSEPGISQLGRLTQERVDAAKSSILLRETFEG